MQIRLTLTYRTVWGENLVLSAGESRHEMHYLSEGRWTVCLDRLRGPYSYEVWKDGACVRREPVPHHLSVPKGVKTLLVRDRWQDRPQDAPFWSDFFKKVVFRRDTCTGAVRSPASVGTSAPSCDSRGAFGDANVTFLVPAAGIRSGQAVAVAGSFNGWQPVPLDDDAFPTWTLAFRADGPFEYKFVIVDRGTRVPVLWEEGPNRIFTEIPSAGEHLTVCDDVPVFATRPWRGAGTAIPVFSLRSEQSFGVGEFRDIRLLVDWAVATGQNVIQLLPVNDTTMSGDWRDSYPYNANTTFALHPQFIHLPDAGVRNDKAYRTLRDELNALPKIDYERVGKEKHRLLRKAFASTKVLDSMEYKTFVRENEDWLLPYAVFCCLRDEHGTPDFSRWGEMAAYSARKAAAYAAEHRSEVDFHCFVQFHLDVQLKDAVAYAHERGVALKGDLPIGISRTSADAWVHPELYHMDSQAGAPPDTFSVFGQNWGFPTYDWEKMSEDGFAWWKARMRKMSGYFDAFRIDHILGFFRIWEIPLHAVHGLLGHFNPALPYPASSLEALGFDMAGGRYCTPPVCDGVIGEIFGERADEVRARFVRDGRLVAEAATQRQVTELLPDDEELREGLLRLLDDVLFIEDPRKPGCYHPRIAPWDTFSYRMLDDGLREKFDRLHEDFFYRRHNAFWRESALAKLPSLIGSTGMLTCGEDLGMIPACVPEVMRDLGILSLEIQRMPKSSHEEFADPAGYPYHCVCATGTHDTSTLRGWWEEDREATVRYWHTMLRCQGDAPMSCEPQVAEKIIDGHLRSPAMLCILPLQDWLAMDGEVRYPGDPADERINVPAVSRHYWRYRMHLTLEALLARREFNDRLKGMVRSAARGE